MEDSFEDIRPYLQEEIPPAMKRIAASELFPQACAWVFPGEDVEAVRNMVRGISSADEFQVKVMKPMLGQIVKRSISDLSYEGEENFIRDAGQLFVSNHRDIVLDATLLQNMLHINGLDTCEITFGANLMCHPLIVDVGKSNKMFKVERGGDNPRDFYVKSLRLSKYISGVIGDGRSVWIAQRNGRTKDGNDATDHGLVKMFSMSGGRNVTETLERLNIIPVAISYEWEPCDILKVKELYARRRGGYTKAPGEDINSILTGINQFKGQVHLAVCKPVGADDLMGFTGKGNDVVNRVTEITTERILRAYKLMPTNFLAFDILKGSERFASEYSNETKAMFISRMESLENEEMKDIFLHIYANPVINKQNL